MTTFSTLGTYLGTKHKALRDWASSTFLTSASRGAANGVAPLDATGKVPSANLPAASTGGVQSVNGDTSSAILLRSVPILDADFTSSIPSGWTYSRASSALYNNGYGVLSSAGVNVPRYERDPTSGRKLGLLIEGADRTNLALWSEKFDDATWVKDQASVVQDSAFGVSPLGTNWWTLTDNTTSGEHTLRQSLTLSVGRYTISALVRDGGTCDAFDLAFGSEGQAMFSIASHKLVGSYFPSSNIVFERADAVQVSGTAWLYALTVNLTTAQTLPCGVMMLQQGGGTAFYVGTAPRTLPVAYVQVEAGGNRTSYVKTTSAPATRARDVLNFDLSSLPLFSQSRGTVVLDCVPLSGGSSYQAFLDINGEDGGYYYIDLLSVGDSLKFEFWDNASQVDLLTPSSNFRARPGVQTTMAAAWSDQDFGFAEGGDLIGNGLGGLVARALKRINVGCRYDVAGSGVGTLGAAVAIQRIRIYADRLPDSELTRLSRAQDTDTERARFERVGVGAGSLQYAPDSLLDINPGIAPCTDNGYYNIYNRLYLNAPNTGNRYSYGMAVVSDPSVSFGSSAYNHYATLAGVSVAATRNNSTDTNSNANNFLLGGSFAATHGALLGMSAVSGSAEALRGNLNAQSGTITIGYGLRAITTAGGNANGPVNGTIGTAYGINIAQNANSGGSGATSYGGYIGTSYGVYVSATTGTTGTVGGRIGTLYGIYLAAQPSMQSGGTGPGVVTSKWAVYQAGASDQSYYAGKVMVGTQYGATPLAASGGANGGGIASILQLDTVGNQNGDGSAIIFTRVQDASTIKARIGVEKREVTNNETDIVISAWDGFALTERVRVVGATGTVVIKSVVNAANDAAAASGGVPVGGIYRNGSALMIRVT